MRSGGGGFAAILRLRSQLFWHSLSHIRRFSPLRMTKRGDARIPTSPSFRWKEVPRRGGGWLWGSFRLTYVGDNPASLRSSAPSRGRGERMVWAMPEV